MQALNMQTRGRILPGLSWTHKVTAIHNGNPTQGGLKEALTDAPIMLVDTVIFTIRAVVTLAKQ